jgi:hypothetical protein
MSFQEAKGTPERHRGKKGTGKKKGTGNREQGTGNRQEGEQCRGIYLWSASGRLMVAIPL